MGQAAGVLLVGPAHRVPRPRAQGRGPHPQRRHARGRLAHADTLNAPGKFLINAPEHDTPRRARADLLTDEVVTDTAAYYADQRPDLDEVSRMEID